MSESEPKQLQENVFPPTPPCCCFFLTNFRFGPSAFLVAVLPIHFGESELPVCNISDSELNRYCCFVHCPHPPSPFFLFIYLIHYLFNRFIPSRQGAV